MKHVIVIGPASYNASSTVALGLYAILEDKPAFLHVVGGNPFADTVQDVADHNPWEAAMHPGDLDELLSHGKTVLLLRKRHRDWDEIEEKCKARCKRVEVVDVSVTALFEELAKRKLVSRRKK